MGYTHNFYKVKEISPLVWEKFLVDFNKVLPSFKNLLDQETNQKLLISNDTIFFNGIGNEAHETFYIDRISEGEPSNHYEDERKGKFGDFCKTNRCDYDIAVCSALIIAKKHFRNDIVIRSDGDNEDPEWISAKLLCQAKLGYGNLDLGDVFKDTDGKYKVRNPKTLGKLLDTEITA